MTGGRKRFLYRIVVDTWPTPDGHPFDKQPAEAYGKAIEAWLGSTEAFPAWMGRIDWARHMVNHDAAPLPGVWMTTRHGHRFTVPAHRRAHFLSPLAASTALQALQDWGAHGHIERSDPITWTGAS